MANKIGKMSLSESLVEAGMITQEQLKQAQAEEKSSGQRLMKVLVKRRLISEEDLANFLSSKLAIPRMELSNYLIDPKVVELVPEELARRQEVMPIFKFGNRLTCAMVDPWNVFALDELRMKSNLTIEPVVATETEIKKALDEQYGAKGTMEEIIRSIDKAKVEVKDGVEIDPKKLQGIVNEPVVIKLVNLLIMKALKERASDIHIEPEEDLLRIRFRVDGVLYEVPSPPKHLQAAVTCRIKVLANLDITERRVPQDGRFNLKMDSQEVDIRVSSMPTIYGENVVLRLLEISSALRSLADLGFSKDILEQFQHLIVRPYGMILVTGPTGSGKTTTLYASLDKINSVHKNIITIEDPVEYRLHGIRQTQVNPRVDLTFATGLKSILRQDPDVIMVGEVRDRETAEISIQASLTGHLVLTTLHTNDAVGAVTRLMDMGIEPFLISSSVIGVLAQRLVRVICKDCREAYQPSVPMLKNAGLSEESGIRFFRGKGCQSCMKIGYKGRIAIYELVIPDEKMRQLILAKSTASELKRHAQSLGMRTLREDGIRAIREGLTTVEEVLAVTDAH